jgi:hypothetical protein
MSPVPDLTSTLQVDGDRHTLDFRSKDTTPRLLVFPTHLPLFGGRHG